MPFIDIISPTDASAKLERIYQQVKGPHGQVDMVLQVHSLRPHTLEGHMVLYKSVLHHTANKLPAWFLEAIGVLVSRINACEYCDLHHSEGLRKLLNNTNMSFEDYSSALGKAEPAEPFNRQQQAALAYAAQLTRAPGSVTQADIDLLKEQGLSDGEILEINQVASYFAYANRTVTGLGVTIGSEALGLSPQSGDGREGWQHD